MNFLLIAGTPQSLYATAKLETVSATEREQKKLKGLIKSRKGFDFYNGKSAVKPLLNGKDSTTKVFPSGKKTEDFHLKSERRYSLILCESISHLSKEYG